MAMEYINQGIDCRASSKVSRTSMTTGQREVVVVDVNQDKGELPPISLKDYKFNKIVKRN